MTTSTQTTRTTIRKTNKFKKRWQYDEREREGGRVTEIERGRERKRDSRGR